MSQKCKDVREQEHSYQVVDPTPHNQPMEKEKEIVVEDKKK